VEPEISPSALSVEVTNQCNLRCKHCFWDNYKADLPQHTDVTVIDSVRAILERYRTITNIVWYGGEPLLNDQTTALVRRGIDELGIKNNMVITNGIHGIPLWHDSTVFFAVSVDGTESAHDFVRGYKTYRKTKANVQQAVRTGTPVGLIYCLNAYNNECVPDFLHEWFDSGIRGVVFTMTAPIRGKTAEVDLTDAQREALVDRLLEQKQIYGDFIHNSETMIRLLHPQYDEVLAQNCMMNRHNTAQRVHSIHMRNDGSLQTPCALGPDVDCLKCRSITHVALFAAKYLRDPESLLALFRMYHAKYWHEPRPDRAPLPAALGARPRDVFSALGAKNGARRHAVRLPVVG
jgi:sulfatase maturation enzyme AslB (radical SAM superfamily)